MHLSLGKRFCLVSAAIVVAEHSIFVCSALAQTEGSQRLPVTRFDLLLLFLAGVLIATLLAFGLHRYARHRQNNRHTAALSSRDWAAAVTTIDGGLLMANEPMRGLLSATGNFTEGLGPIVDADAAALYRMSRVAVRDGLAIEPIVVADTEDALTLTVQYNGDDTLVWQIVPRARLGLGAPAPIEARLDHAPFGIVRFDGIEAPRTNATFGEIFAPSAIDVLREQIDAGIFSVGRILLPTVPGPDRLALSAMRVEAGEGGNTIYEVFLFLPDAETRGQVSAADTLEAIPISLLRLDVEGRVFWGNAQARKMLRSSFEIGRTLGQIVQPLGRTIENLLHDVRTGREGSTGEMMRLLDSRGDTFVQVSLTLMTIQGQPSIMAVLTDASELRLLEDKFAQSQKMEAVGKLAGGVAHDFNNVLTAVSGHCDLLLLRKDANHPDFSDLTQIRQNANRAAALVRQLLAFSRKQTLQPRLLSVQDVVTDTLYLLDRLIGETITLSLEHGRDLGSVRADNQQLEQALMNLVVNARDAMPNGGKVTIATENRTILTEEKRTGIVIPPGDYVEIRVMDSGHGIDPQVIGKVFDPFFTTKPQGEGTGLGLSTVYGIVKQSGGYILAENRDAGGACFTILLPRVEASQRELPRSTITAEAQRTDQTGQGAVMLVEDEAPVRSFASRALKLRGYQVIEAESAEEAMELLTTEADTIDVLVSDVVMPGMDGPTFAQKARELRPDLRVIFISGYAEDSFRKNLHDDDFLFLPKPFSLNDLTSKVKMAMLASGVEAPEQGDTAA